MLFTSHWQPEIADEAGNTYIAKTIASILILSANVGFRTTKRSKTCRKVISPATTDNIIGNIDMAV